MGGRAGERAGTAIRPMAHFRTDSRRCPPPASCAMLAHREVAPIKLSHHESHVLALIRKWQPTTAYFIRKALATPRISL